MPPESATTPMVIRCGWCFAILTTPGALLFTPPDDIGRCFKIHLCVKCYQSVVAPPTPVAISRDRDRAR
jgi:hypothetical protein